MKKNLNLILTILIIVLIGSTHKAIADSCFTAVKDESGKILHYKVNTGANCTQDVSLNNGITTLSGKCSLRGECVLSQVILSECLKFVNSNNSQGSFIVNPNASCSISLLNSGGQQINVPGTCSSNIGACLPNNPCVTFDGMDKYNINIGASCFIFNSNSVSNGSCNFEGKCTQY